MFNKIRADLSQLFSIIRIKISDDYGMCCNEEAAIECSKVYYYRKFKVDENNGVSILRNLFWRKFPQRKPVKDGWYQCTINFECDTKYSNNKEETIYQEYVMDLYWNCGSGRFIDNRVKQIFEVYDVMGYGQNNEYHKLSLRDIHTIDRTDHVVAWRVMPKTYRKRGRKFK